MSLQINGTNVVELFDKFMKRCSDDCSLSIVINRNKNGKKFSSVVVDQITLVCEPLDTAYKDFVTIVNNSANVAFDGMLYSDVAIRNNNTGDECTVLIYGGRAAAEYNFWKEMKEVCKILIGSILPYRELDAIPKNKDIEDVKLSYVEAKFDNESLKNEVTRLLSDKLPMNSNEVVAGFSITDIVEVNMSGKVDIYSLYEKAVLQKGNIYICVSPCCAGFVPIIRKVRYEFAEIEDDTFEENLRFAILNSLNIGKSVVTVWISFIVETPLYTQIIRDSYLKLNAKELIPYAMKLIKARLSAQLQNGVRYVKELDGIQLENIPAMIDNDKESFVEFCKKNKRTHIDFWIECGDNKDSYSIPIGGKRGVGIDLAQRRFEECVLNVPVNPEFYSSGNSTHVKAFLKVNYAEEYVFIDRDIRNVREASSFRFELSRHGLLYEVESRACGAVVE